MRQTLDDFLGAILDAGLPLPLVCGAAPDETPPAAATTPDPMKHVEALLAKHGSHDAALKSLVAANNLLNNKLDAALAKIPGDGALVLTGDDAKAWGGYTQLGKPSEVRKAIEEGAAARAKAEAFERKELHAKAAAIEGYKPAVLDSLAVRDGVTITFKTAVDPRTGKEGEKPFVKGEGDKSTPLAEYAATNWGDFKESLTAAPPPRPPGTPPRNDNYQPHPLPDAAPDGVAALVASGRYARM